MRFSFVLAGIAILTISPTCAQTINIERHQPSVFVMRPTIKVQENFLVPLNATGDTTPSSVGQALSAARTELYKMVQQECGTLGQSFSSDCRIVGFSITVARNFIPIGTNGNVTTTGPSLRSVDANATYELKARE